MPPLERHDWGFGRSGEPCDGRTEGMGAGVVGLETSRVQRARRRWAASGEGQACVQDIDGKRLV